MECTKLFIIVLALTVSGKGNAQKDFGPIEYDAKIGLIKRFGKSEGSGVDKVSLRWKLNATRFDRKFILILHFNGIKDYDDNDEILLPDDKRLTTEVGKASGCLKFAFKNRHHCVDELNKLCSPKKGFNNVTKDSMEISHSSKARYDEETDFFFYTSFTLHYVFVYCRRENDFNDGQNKSLENSNSNRNDPSEQGCSVQQQLNATTGHIQFQRDENTEESDARNCSWKFNPALTKDAFLLILKVNYIRNYEMNDDLILADGMRLSMDANHFPKCIKFASKNKHSCVSDIDKLYCQETNTRNITSPSIEMSLSSKPDLDENGKFFYLEFHIDYTFIYCQASIKSNEEKNQQVKRLSAKKKACTPAIAAAGCLGFIVVVCGIAIVILCIQKRTAQQLNNQLKISLSGYNNSIEASAGGSQPPSSENEQRASTSKDASYSVVLKKQVVDNILYEPLKTAQQSKNQ